MKLRGITSSGSLEDKLLHGPDVSSSDILTDEVGYHVISMILFHINVMQEFNYYYAEFRKGEMVGPLNYYRTSRFRYDEELGKERESHGFLFTASLINYCLHAGLSPNLRPDLPYLFIWGTKDPTALPSVIPKSREYIPRYQDIALEGRHHWLMIEAKDEITERIVKWLEGLSFGGLEKL